MAIVKSWIRRTVVIATACLLLIGAIAFQVRAIPAAHARALLSCSGASCNNRDPGQYGCTGGSSYYFGYSNSHGWLRFWYSPTCQANWSEGAANSGWMINEFDQENCPTNTFDQYSNCTDQGGLPHVTYCEGSGSNCLTPGGETFSFDDITATHWYTNMIDGRYKARGILTLQSGSTLSTINSGWH